MVECMKSTKKYSIKSSLICSLLACLYYTRNTVIQEIALGMMRMVEVMSTVVILQSLIRHCKYYTGIYCNEDAIRVSPLDL